MRKRWLRRVVEQFSILKLFSWFLLVRILHSPCDLYGGYHHFASGKRHRVHIEGLEEKSVRRENGFGENRFGENWFREKIVSERNSFGEKILSERNRFGEKIVSGKNSLRRN